MRFCFQQQQLFPAVFLLPKQIDGESLCPKRLKTMPLRISAREDFFIDTCGLFVPLCIFPWFIRNFLPFYIFFTIFMALFSESVFPGTVKVRFLYRKPFPDFLYGWSRMVLLHNFPSVSRSFSGLFLGQVQRQAYQGHRYSPFPS